MKTIEILCFVILATNGIAQDNDAYPYDGPVKHALDSNLQPINATIIIRHDQATPKIELKVDFINTTDQELWVDLTTQPLLDVHVEIKNAQGNFVASNGRLASLNISNYPRIHQEYAPGEGQAYHLNLSKVYDLQSGQSYMVRVSKVGHLETSGTRKLFVSSWVQFTAP